MEVSVTNARAQLSTLVRRAESGDEVVITRHGKPAARIVPVADPPDESTRRALIASIQAASGHAATSGPAAARSQDFLYDERGLPK